MEASEYWDINGIYCGCGFLIEETYVNHKTVNIINKLVNEYFIYDEEVIDNILKLLENYKSKHELCLK